MNSPQLGAEEALEIANHTTLATRSYRR